MAGKRKRLSGGLHEPLVSALTASRASAAPLRRLLSFRGVLSSILLLPGTTSHADEATSLTSALSSMHGTCIAQLLSVLYDEVKCRRNTGAVLRFVAWIITLRYASDQQHIPSDDGWIPCLAFMISYHSMLDRVERLRRGGDGSCSDILEDEIVSTSVQVARRVRHFDTTQPNGTSQIERTTSLVQRCFTRQFSRLDALVTKLGETTSMRHHASEVRVPSQEHGHSTNTSTIGDTKDWWDGVDLPSSDEEDHNTSCDDFTENEEEDEKQPNDRQTGDPSELQDVSSNQTNKAEMDNPLPLPAAEEDEWPVIEKAAMALREELIGVAKSATSSDIQSYSDRISELIHRSGAERGASGVTDVGSILTYGSITENNITPGGHIPGPMPLCDVLLQQLTKKCLDGSISAIRAAAYIRSFLLPVASQIGFDAAKGKKKVASRILTSTITSLARERPVESVEALFIPLLCPRTNCSHIGSEEPNQAQCELVSKVIRFAQLPQNAIAKFIAGLVRENAMTWTDSSMPVLTTLLAKRPVLCDEIVRDLASIIEQKSGEMCKNLKFSALFLSLVTKNGSAVPADCIDALLLSAQKLKTFSGKSIATALKRISMRK